MGQAQQHSPDIGPDIRETRARIRRGDYAGPTAGLAAGRLQGNVVILPEGPAKDFALFCRRNPKPCPVVAMSRPGDPFLPALGADIDIRSDVPAYRVYRNGRHTDTLRDITDLWQDDFVTFVLGCSFTFEQALERAGIALPHTSTSHAVPMFKTSIQTEPAGPFRGQLVVSMRALKPGDVARATEITARFEHAHGAPVHAGDPAQIGIEDLGKPDFGDPVEVASGDVPVFWACGVTPQSALEQARPEFCITHEPGAMLITDRPADDTRVFDVKEWGKAL